MHSVKAVSRHDAFLWHVDYCMATTVHVKITTPKGPLPDIPQHNSQVGHHAAYTLWFPRKQRLWKISGNPVLDASRRGQQSAFMRCPLLTLSSGEKVDAFRMRVKIRQTAPVGRLRNIMHLRSCASLCSSENQVGQTAPQGNTCTILHNYGRAK